MLSFSNEESRNHIKDVLAKLGIPLTLPPEQESPYLRCPHPAPLFLQSFVFLHETRSLGSCQEIRDLLAYGWRRKLPAIDPFKTSSAKVAEACSSTKKLAIDGYGDCAQVRSCNAGDTTHPTRRAVRKTLTHAKKCQLIHKTPKIREQTVAVAHAEAKTVIKTTTQTVAAKMDASPAVAAAIPDAKARVNPNSSAVPCPLQPSRAGGRNSSTL